MKMKKRILSILLAMCMALSLAPTAVFSAAVDYGFVINGQSVTSENIHNLSGVTGTISYDPTTKTLTLDNATITVSASPSKVPLGIYCKKAVSAITLIGKNEIKFGAETYTDSYYIYGIIFAKVNGEEVTIRGNDREKDILKITMPKIESQYTTSMMGIDSIGNNLTVETCTLDILFPGGKSLYGIRTSDAGAARHSITIKNSIFHGVIGKDRNGTVQTTSYASGNVLYAYGSDITITDSVVTAGFYSEKIPSQTAALEGRNLTLTNCQLTLDAKGGSKTEAGNKNASVRALHASGGKIILTNCHGTITSMNGSDGKSYGIDLWNNVPDQCLTIDRCSLDITAGMQAILIEGDSNTAKQPIFKNINRITYGADAAGATTEKAGAVTAEYYWRNPYFKSLEYASGVTINKETLTLTDGESETLTAEVIPSRAEQRVTWSSDNVTIATVDATGKVTAVGAGTANITAAADDGSGVSATCAVTVNPYPCTVNYKPDANTAETNIYTDSEPGQTTVRGAQYTRLGYTQSGWQTDDGTPYAFESTYSGRTPLTLYPTWTVNAYTITVKPENGDAEFTITQDYGTAVTAPTLTKTGYTFAGWDVPFPTTMPAENRTITAKWTVNAYTITVKPENGDADFTITQDYGTAVTAPTLTKTGYTFAGWDVPFPTTMPAENRTITAKWTVNAYTITVKPENGDAEFLITQDYGTAVTAPTLTKTGYTFAGWDVPFPTTMPAENRTITAKWTINSYTVTFDTDGGSPVAPITQNYGTAITKPADPKKTGYLFDGWDTAIPATMPAQNLTIKAKWTLCDHKGNTNALSCTKETICSVCEGKVPAQGHVELPGYRHDERTHWIECRNCTEKLHQTAHSGGTATCWRKAKCEYCGEFYGTIDKNNHTDLHYVPYRRATEKEEGNFDHWHCGDCDRYFLNSAATVEVPEWMLVIDRLKSGDDQKGNIPTGGESAMPWAVPALLCAAAAIAHKKSDVNKTR